MSNPINLSRSGPPETVLTPENPEALAALTEALALEPDAQRIAVNQIVAAYPKFLTGWATVGDAGRDVIESYAAYRVGYHRGLDALRQSGWRGSGFVRWQHESNRGFLRSLHGLARSAEAIRELDEAERCQIFLRQCDPSWPPADLTS